MDCRSYYRCAYNGCNAKKQVQQKTTAYAPEYEVIFVNEHTCSTTTGLSVPQLTPPSPSKGKKLVSFESNDPRPRMKDQGVFSPLSVETASSPPLQLITPELYLDDGLALLPPMSPAGHFYGSDASHYGLDETFDP